MLIAFRLFLLNQPPLERERERERDREREREREGERERERERGREGERNVLVWHANHNIFTLHSHTPNVNNRFIKTRPFLIKI